MGLSNAGQEQFIVDLTTWGKLPLLNGTTINGLFTLSGNVQTPYTASYSADISKSWASGDVIFGDKPALALGGELSDMIRAMETWSNVAGIKFFENNANPQLVFSQVDFPANNNGTISGIMVPETIIGNTRLAQADIGIYAPWTDFTKGSAGFKTMIHEIGHAMGLSHPAASGENTSYDTSTTIMSYNKYKNYYAHTPMIYDIAAAQYLYGANEDHKNGDDTHAATGEKKLWTIWDAGGVHDRLDIASALGASKGAVIDLRGGVNAANDNILHKKLVMIKNYA